MIQAILNAFQVAITTFFNFVPHLVGFLVIAFVGWLVGMAVDKAVTALLRKVGFARLSDRVGLTRMEQRMGMRVDSSKILGRIAFWFIFLIFLIPAADSLGVPTISNTLSTILDYLPNVFVAILALFLGTILATFAADLASKTARASNAGNPNVIGNVVRWSIIGFACLIALEQLRIAPQLITVLFTAIMGGLALAFGLAFGLGGRDHAGRLLSRSESSLMASRPYDPNQIVQQARADLTHSEQIGQHYASPEVTPTQAPTYGTNEAVSPPAPTYGQQTVPPSPQSYPGPNPMPKHPNPGV
jgi:hypothetical protein